MKKLLLLLAALAIPAFGNACVSQATATTNWGSASTWSNCGADGGSLDDDAASASEYTGSGANTWAHTVGSCSNRILIVGIFGQSTDGLSSVTYGGVAMTLITKYQGSPIWTYAYKMIAPPTGTANIVVTSSVQVTGVAESYCGARQTSNPEASATFTTSATTTPATSITTLSDGAWMVGIFVNNGPTTLTAGTGNTVRARGPVSTFNYLAGLFDTNGIVSPPALTTMTINQGASLAASTIALSIAPATGPAGGTTPQPGDTATIVSAVVLDTDVSVTSITINNASAQLTTDGVAAHTITTTGGVTVTRGCSAVAGACTTANAIDTSGGSAGKEVTWERTGIGTGEYLITSAPSVTTKLNLSRSIFEAGDGRALRIDGSVGTFTLTVNNSLVIDGEEGFDIQQINTLNINNLSSTGLTTGPFIYIHSATPSTCSLQNITQMGATSDLAMIRADADWSACSLTGNALLGDEAGVYAPGLFNANPAVTPAASQTWSYNFGKSYHVGQEATINGFTACPGSSSHHCTWTKNILEGFSQPYYTGTVAYLDLIDNICIARSNVGSEQGCIFGFGSTHVTDTGSVVTVPPEVNSNILYFSLGNTIQPSQITATRLTLIASPVAEGDAPAAEFGEPGDILNVVDSSFSNSLVVNGVVGVNSAHADNTFVNTGTGGVGSFNNNVFGASDDLYRKAGTSLNFDDGANAHPHASYGDSTIDPKIYAPNRSWADCDAILNGTGIGGTTSHLFTQLFNRWNGTNAAQYTPQRIYNCMRAGYAPQAVSLARGASDGSYIGAVRPIVPGMAFGQ